MKIQIGQKATVFALLMFGGCVTCAVIAHYCEAWMAFMAPAFLFSSFSWISIAAEELE